MKKRLILSFLTALALSQSLHVSAQKYRGDIEASFGYALFSFATESIRFDERCVLDITTSHGVQINKLFLGLGTGLMLINISEISDPHLNIPLFFTSRYDFWNNNGINPYISIKAGDLLSSDYFLRTSHYKEYIENGTIYNDRNDSYYYGTGLYLQPQVGMRIRTGKNTGMNIGLSYNLINIKEKTEVYEHSHENGIFFEDYTTSREISKNAIKGILSLTFGFDF